MSENEKTTEEQPNEPEKFSVRDDGPTTIEEDIAAEPELSPEDQEALDLLERSKVFPAFIQAMRGGKYSATLGEKLKQLVMRLREEGRARSKASATIDLKFSFQIDEVGQLTVVPNFKITEPKMVIGDSIFWTDDDGNVLSRDPKQFAFSFGDIPAPRKVEPKKVATKVEPKKQPPRKL